MVTNSQNALTVQLSTIGVLSDLTSKIICIVIAALILNTSDHSKNSFVVFFDPQNIDVDTIIISLSVILTEL